MQNFFFHKCENSFIWIMGCGSIGYTSSHLCWVSLKQASSCSHEAWLSERTNDFLRHCMKLRWTPVLFVLFRGSSGGQWRWEGDRGMEDVRQAHSQHRSLASQDAAESLLSCRKHGKRIHYINKFNISPSSFIRSVPIVLNALRERVEVGYS